MLEQRRLGSTGLLVTPIGLGLAAVGRPGYITVGRERDLGADRSVEALEGRTHRLLDAAWASGIRYVDAARSYGLAEAFLGSWLDARGLGPEDLTVGSKWGYTYTADWLVGAEVNEVKDHSLATLRRQLAESRALLGNRLRLYQIHSATRETGVLADRAVLGELARLRAEGLAIGLTVSGPRQADTIRAALEVRVDGAAVFQAVQATWNVLEPSAGEALADAHRAGLGVIVKEALANGRLAGRWPPAAQPVIERIREQVAGSPDAIAIAAVLAQPWADVVLSGAVDEAQLASNLQAVEIRLSGDVRAALASLAVAAADYWSDRSALPWT